MADTPGDPGEQSAADAAQSDAIGGGSGNPGGDGFDGLGDSRSQGGFDNSSLGKGVNDGGFFGGIMDSITGNPVASGLQALGMLTGVPALGIMGLMAHAGKALGGTPGTAGDDPGGGDGGPEDQIQQVVPPLYNPIESMVGSDYVAYGGVGADQLRKQLFPYMNFNQPTQPGVSGLVGEYAGVGQGTGLMTGPFGMSNTQV